MISMTYLGEYSMGPLTALTVSLAALKLGGVSSIGWGIIIVPAALQGFYNFANAYFAYRKMEKFVKELEKMKEGEGE